MGTACQHLCDQPHRTILGVEIPAPRRIDLRTTNQIQAENSLLWLSRSQSTSKTVFNSQSMPMVVADNPTEFELTEQATKNIPDSEKSLFVTRTAATSKYEESTSTATKTVFYKGEYDAKGFAEGQGRYESDYAVFEGIWKRGVPYSGTYSFVVYGVKVILEEGSRGEIYWPDGKKYHGQLKNLRPHGRGIVSFENGDEQEGNWQNGIALGIGKYMYQDGTIFTKKKHGGGDQEQQIEKYRMSDKGSKLFARGAL